jgi:hypothetical protein
MFPTRGSVQRLADEISHGRLVVQTAVDEAIRRADADAACELMLAAAAAGQPPDTAHVAAVLPDLSHVGLFPLLLGVCGGDRVTMLLDLVEQDRMSDSRDAMALFFAVELLSGAPPPPRLAALLRTRTRRGIGPEASILIALAAKALGDPGVLEVAKEWLPMAEVVEAKRLRKELMHQLSTPPLDQLPEQPPPRVVSGFTVRRPVAKVGRNDPCPCGSGKKYKRCCEAKDAERAADPSPLPGLTRTEYLHSAGQHITADEVDELRPYELAEIDFTTLATRPLISAVRRATSFRRWELAERAMDALAVRTDAPSDDGDGYRAEVIGEAVRAGNTEVAERQLALIRDRTCVAPSDLLALELRRPTAGTLARLEEMATTGLRAPRGLTLIELSHALLNTSPAMGILVTRASLSAERLLDSELLVDLIEEARDRLALPPGDPARELFEQMLERDTSRRVDELVRRGESAEQERLASEADGLREKLRESKARVAALERGLRKHEASLVRLPPRPADEPRTAAPPVAARPPPAAIATPPVTASPSPADEAERRRLRAKVDELKQLLTERNEERAALRKQLVRVNDAIVAEAPEVERAPESQAADSEEGEAVDASRALLVPAFAASCRAELQELPVAVARKSLAVVASLAGGDVGAWRQVKRMAAAMDPLLSCRVGIHHRVLFRAGQGELAVLSVIHRKDLETGVKRHGRIGPG